MQGVADVVDPSTLSSADGPAVPNVDNTATLIVLCDAVGPADTPVVKYEVDGVTPHAVAPMCDVIKMTLLRRSHAKTL